MLRAASVMDVDQLLLLEEELFPNAMTERMLQHELHRGVGWVVEEGGQILGYALVRSDEELRDLIRLGVSSRARRRGIARQLLDQVIVDGGTIMLTVQKDNLPALTLYRSYGFQIVAHLAAANAWVMKLVTSH